MKIWSLFAASDFRETVPLGLNIAAVRENVTNEYEWLTGGRSETVHRGGDRGASSKKELSKEMSPLHIWAWARICKRLKSSGIDSASLCSMAGRYDNPICHTGPPGYIGWLNHFLQIDSLNVYKFGLRCKKKWGRGIGAVVQPFHPTPLLSADSCSNVQNNDDFSICSRPRLFFFLPDQLARS